MDQKQITNDNNSSVVKFSVFPGNHPEEIRNVLKKNKNFEEIPYKQEELMLQQCNLIWKPLDLTFKQLSKWDQITKQNFNQQFRILNHIENMRNITTKTGLVRSLKRFYSNFQNQVDEPSSQNENELIQVFDVIPTTFIVHSQFKTSDIHKFLKRYSDLSTHQGMSLQERMPQKHCKNNMWLVKPAALNQGRGIQIFSKIRDIFEFLDSQGHQNDYWVVQKYVERPLLFKNRKFDIRMWALVTMGPNGQDLSLHFYQQGYVRTSSSDYDLSDENKYIHLTNNCLQQKGDAYGQHEVGNTISFDSLQKFLDQAYPEYNVNIQRDFLPRMKDIMIDTIIAIKDNLNPTKRKNSFELLGYDFLIDEDFRVWLLEVNNNPYLGVPNDFIRGLLPQMIRDMFSIVIPNDTFRNRELQKGFQLLYNEEKNVNLRREMTIENLYPVKSLKQLIGKEKRNAVINQRKLKLRLKDNANLKIKERNLQLLTPNYSSSAAQNLSSLLGNLNQKELQLINNEHKVTLMKTLFREKSPQPKDSIHQKSIVEEYKEIHDMAVMNQELQQKINPNQRSPKINNFEYALQDENSTSNPQTSQQLMKRVNNFKKDLLQETKDLIQKSSQQITQNQFDYLINKIFVKIQQWELFDDKSLNKALECYDQLCKSKTVFYFLTSTIFGKIITLLQNENIPFRIKNPLISQLESKVKIFNTSSQLYDQKGFSSLLQIYLTSNYDDDSDEKKLQDIIMKIGNSLLQIDQNNNSIGYIPKYTKEKDQLRQKAIENGILLIFIKAKINKVREIDINKMFNKLNLKDWQLQMTLLDQSTTESENQESNTEVQNYIMATVEKLKSDLQTQQQKYVQFKLKQQEDDLKEKQRREEEKEQQRKQAEEQFFKRIEEKKKKKAEELRLQLQEQMNIQKDLEEKRKEKLERIRQRQLKLRSTNAVVPDGFKLEKIIGAPQVNPEKIQVHTSKKRKIKSFKKDFVDLSNLMDNLIVFTQQKLKDTKRLEQSPPIFKDELTDFSINFIQQPSVNVPQFNFGNSLSETLPTQLTSSLPSQGNILKNFKQIKEKPDLSDLSQAMSRRDDIITPSTANIIPKDKKKNYSINKGLEKKNIGSFTKVFNFSEKKIQRNQMVLPSLDYENQNTLILNKLNNTVKNQQTSHYFKQRAHSKMLNTNQTPSSLTSHPQKQRRLSPLVRNNNDNSTLNQSVEMAKEKAAIEYNQQISDVILLMLNSRKPKLPTNKQQTQ